MKDLYFTGLKENRWAAEPKNIPHPILECHTDISNYIVDEDLKMAVNVSLLLGKPLLITGEPGTGKTQLADVVAAELGLGKALKFATKSTSIAKDLFYIYDSLGRFHAAHNNLGNGDPLNYITFCSLGEAILRANSNDVVAKYLPGSKHTGPKRSVVIIDEIEKAPRDFPNDLLIELDKMQFCIPELKNALIAAPEELRPIVIITSNSEKPLPEAFVRRCIFHYIEFPEANRLKEIVKSKVGDYMKNGDEILNDLILFFMKLRDPRNGIQKKPATAELLDWIIMLRSFSMVPNPCRDRNTIRQSLSTLIKNTEDLELAYKITDEWIAG